VVVDASRDEGMRELQQDRASPPEEHDPLGIDAPGQGAVTHDDRFSQG
jgi:hypothetical protein